MKDKWALVTGATAGLGLAVAESLAGAGANIVLHDLTAPKQAADRLRARFGVSVISAEADLSHRCAIEAMMSELSGRCGGIDILVNNAGVVGQIAPFEEIPAEIYSEIYEVNVVSMVRLVKAVLPVMKAKKWGRIINISSENGLQPDPDMTPYNLTKAAIINLSKSLSKTLGQYNILVNTVSPAFIYTPLVEDMIKGIAARQGSSDEEALQRFLSEKRPHIELRRIGRIDEVGAAVAFLASEQASFITGTNLRVDGGSVASI